ncbi:DUF2931 family protein [Sphingobacterium sp.]|uniref:DUF2931 family protein n=1 Tax=Sphingobacterium sp. TaxID=341027 RepID=UPI0028AA2DC9|nr:DUF2931 family protein [Sphingobacterium sp.]
MILRATVSAFLVAVFSLVTTLLVHNADLNMVYAAFCCSPYFIVITLVYFHFNKLRKKFNVLEEPKFVFELGYGFLFYCLFSLLLPVLLFLSTLDDEYEHQLYADLGGVIREMFPLIVTLSIFLTFFSSVIITWALKSWKYLVPTLLGFLVLIPIIFAFSTTIHEISDLREERLTQADNIKEGRYKWYCAMSNPSAYPVQLYKGRFVFPKDNDYEFTFSEGNLVNYNAVWGQAGGGSYEQVMSLPKALDITWYSFVEDTFYRMNGPVDYNKIRALFGASYAEKGATNTIDEHYNKIILGFAPGGVLVIWAAGTGRRQIEIGRYQAEKVTINAGDQSKPHEEYGNIFNQEWREHVLSDTSIIPSDIRRAIADKPIPYGYWDKLRVRYLVQPKFVLSSDIKAFDADFEFYNAERVVFDESLRYMDMESRGIPKDIYVKWYDQHNNRCAARFIFDEDETFQNFASFFGDKKDLGAELEISIDTKTKIAKATLKNARGHKILLETQVIAYGEHF